MNRNQEFKSRFAAGVHVRATKNLYLNEKAADVYFEFESGERVPAHKGLLAAASDVFDIMFYGSLPEERTVKITDASAAGFKQFLQFFYLKEVELTIANVGDVMNLGNKYNVPECIEIGRKFLELNLMTDNVCQIYGLPIIQDQMQLKEMCEDEIAKNTKEVFKSEGFIECSRNVLQNILELDALSCSEIDVFKACMSWTRKASNQVELTREIVEKYLGDLLYEIRFRSMQLNEFTDLLLTYKSVFSSDEINEILQMIRNKEYEPNGIFNGNERVPRLEWDNNRVVVGERLSFGRHVYLVGNVDITHFTTDKFVLLGGLFFAPIYKNKHLKKFENDVAVDMTIAAVSHSGQNAVHNYTFELEHKDFTYIKLQKPVLFHPRIKYEIRLDLQKSVWANFDLRPRVYACDATITFDNESNSDGIIKGLIYRYHFNSVK